MSLDAGGHLTHGAKPAMSGKWFNAIQVLASPRGSPDRLRQVEALAREHKPTLIIAGGSAYPRTSISPASARSRRGRRIFMVDMAHFAGLGRGGRSIRLRSATPMSSPPPRTRPLRGPRGGMVLTMTRRSPKKINRPSSPGLQAGR
jgi:glycine hydroxymethyltransferase